MISLTKSGHRRGRLLHDSIRQSASLVAVRFRALAKELNLRTKCRAISNNNRAWNDSSVFVLTVDELATLTSRSSAPWKDAQSRTRGDRLFRAMSGLIMATGQATSVSPLAADTGVDGRICCDSIGRTDTREIPCRPPCFQGRKNHECSVDMHVVNSAADSDAGSALDYGNSRESQIGSGMLQGVCGVWYRVSLRQTEGTCSMVPGGVENLWEYDICGASFGNIPLECS